MPVIAARPRILLDANIKATLLVKKNANDADWKGVLADANKYVQGTVIPWNVVSASDPQYYGTNNIFFSYCGSGWQDAAGIVARLARHPVPVSTQPEAGKPAVEHTARIVDLSVAHEMEAIGGHPDSLRGGFYEVAERART